MDPERRKETEKFRRTLLTANRVGISHGSETILENISFDLKEGESLALVGPNGAGKTTLIRIILGEEVPDSGFVSWTKDVRIGYVPQYVGEIDTEQIKTVGDFFYQGKSLFEIKVKMSQIETLLSKPGFAPDLLSKYGELQEKFEINGGWEVEIEAKKALVGIGLPGVELNQEILTLSGGQKTKLFIAQAIVSSPDILILDEPTNHLDSSSVTWLQTYLRSYRGAILVVSHNPQFLDPFISGVLELRLDTRSADEYKGNYTEYLIKRSERELAYKRTMANQDKEIGRQRKIIEHLRGGVRAATAKSREKRLERLRENTTNVMPVARKAREVSIRFDTLQESGRDVLCVAGLRKKFGELVLDYSNLSLSIQKGERIIVLGPEGAGKSTFLKLISGDLQSEEGNIQHGTNVSIGYYRQEHENLNNNNTVFEELRENGMGITEGKLRAVLGHFLFPGESINKKVEFLSQGEKSRLALAKLVLGHHNFLVLDEPTNHLDLASKKRLIEALENFQGTLLVVSHDEEFINELNFNRAVIFPDGEIEIL